MNPWTELHKIASPSKKRQRIQVAEGDDQLKQGNVNEIIDHVFQSYYYVENFWTWKILPCVCIGDFSS